VIALVLLFWHLDADYRAFLGEVGKHSSPTSDTSSGVTGHSYQVGVWPQSSLSDEQQHSAPQVPAAALVEALQAYLNGRLGLFDDAHHFDEYGLKVGEMDLRAYVRRLEDMHTRFFVSNSSTSTSTSESDYITQVRSRLSLRPPTEAYAPRPAVLSTTDKNPDDLPEMFDEWSLKMPDLEVMAYGDAQLDEWVAQRFGGTGLQDIWNRLPRAVLKSDVFRYLVLLLDGGIYADSDSELAIHFCKS
jgi:hypothetical protein